MARTTTAATKNGVAGKNAFDTTTTNTSANTSTRPAPRPVTVAENKPAQAAAPARTPATGRPTQEQIGRRAYEIYLDRCQRGQPGSPHGDWVQAEAELM